MRNIVPTLLVLTLCLPACAPTPPAPEPPTETSITLTVAADERARFLYEPVLADLEGRLPNVQLQFIPLARPFVDATTTPALAQSADVVVATVFDWDRASGLFADLTPLRDADASFDASTFWPGLQAGCQVQGRLIGLPVTVQPRLLYADRRAFDAARLPLPQTGWDWATFLDTVRTLTTDRPTTRYGLVPLLEPPLTTLSATPDAALRQQYAEFVALGEEGALPQTDADQNQIIASGQAALWTDASETVATRQEQLAGAVVALPYPSSDGTPRSAVLADCAMISNGSQQLPEAWQVAAALTAQSFSLAPWHLPARQTVAESARVLDALDPALRPAYEAVLPHLVLESDTQREQVAAALLQAASGTTDLDTALTALAAPVAANPSPAPQTVASPVPDSDTANVIRFHTRGLLEYTIGPVLEQFARETPGFSVQRVSAEALQSGGEGAILYDPQRVANAVDCAIGTISDPALAVDLLPLLDADAATRAELPDAVLAQQRTPDGRLPFLPLVLDSVVVYYNKTLLAERGIPEPDGNWTREEFQAMVAQAASGSGDTQVYGLLTGGIGGHALPFTMALYDVDLNTTPTDDPTVQEALQWLTTAAADGVLAPGALQRSTPETLEQAEALIRAGRVAFWTGQSQGSLGDSADAANALDQVISYGMVAPPGSTVGYVGFPTTFGIVNTTAQTEGCWQLGAFLLRHMATQSPVPVAVTTRASSEWRTLVGEERATQLDAALTRSQGRIMLNAGERVLLQALPQLAEQRDVAAALAALQPVASGLRTCQQQASTTAATQQCFADMAAAVQAVP